MQLSHVGYYSDFVVYPVLIAGLSATSLAVHGVSGTAVWLSVFVVSVVSWTLLEYLLHRFAFHHFPLLRDMHRHHHVEEHDRYGTPTWVSLGCFGLIVFLPALWGAGLLLAGALSAGLMTGYLWYISVHHIVHHWHPPHGGYVYGLKRRHALHHHFDETANFGVTSGFWDAVFGTAAVTRRRSYADG